MKVNIYRLDELFVNFMLRFRGFLCVFPKNLLSQGHLFSLLRFLGFIVGFDFALFVFACCLKDILFWVKVYR